MSEGQRGQGECAASLLASATGAAEGVRARCEDVFSEACAGRIAHWTLHLAALPAVVDRVVALIAATYPDPSAIPYHSRWRHFGAGGVDRVAELDTLLSTGDEDEWLAARIDLAVTSVLLDAGAGPGWSYRDANGRTYVRSEGLAVASYEMFLAGAFSSDSGAPYRADARALATLDAGRLAQGFQVTAQNPLVGLEGRAALLRRLGETIRDARGGTVYFGEGRHGPARIGHLGGYLRRSARDGSVSAAAVLDAVIGAFGPIWPVRDASLSPGDVWAHSRLGVIPFHKLSQWLTYSLCEPLEWAGLAVVDLDRLTGLAEYRNGGLFVDAGVLVPARAESLDEEHAVGSDLVIEWRALTIALLDRVADGVRARLKLSAEALPLARVLEGGTWKAGRAIAAEKRAGGAPPLRIASDGTVF
jgi:hypothetical protein